MRISPITIFTNIVISPNTTYTHRICRSTLIGVPVHTYTHTYVRTHIITQSQCSLPCQSYRNWTSCVLFCSLKITYVHMYTHRICRSTLLGVPVHTYVPMYVITQSQYLLPYQEIHPTGIGRAVCCFAVLKLHTNNISTSEEQDKTNKLHLTNTCARTLGTEMKVSQHTCVCVHWAQK